MSANNSKRLFTWIFPIVVFVSALAVRSLEASPATSLPATSAAAVSGPEVADPLLKRLIARFADAARARHP
jgi:hypothetical protein